MQNPTPDLPIRTPHPMYADEAATGTKSGGPRRSHTEKVDQSRAIRAALGGTSVLYAVQFPDGIIKIGCTADLAARHRHFRSKGGEIVGFVAGDYDAETALHQTLRPHVARGREWYYPTPEVVGVVNGWRERYDLPPLAA